MVKPTRPSLTPGSQASFPRPDGRNHSQSSQAAESARGSLTQTCFPVRSKPIGISAAPESLGQDDRSQRLRGNSTDPSGSYRPKPQKAANGPQSPRSPASSSRVVTKDVATVTETLHRVHLSEPKHNQCCVQKHQPKRDQSTTGRGHAARDTRGNNDGKVGGQLNWNSYADATRQPSKPQVWHGVKLFTATNSSNFACLVCKHIVLISRMIGVPIAPETQQCQLVVTERAVRRGAARRHIRPSHTGREEGVISQLQYHNLNDGQYIQEARVLARRLNIGPDEKDDFMWRECFVALYPMFRPLKRRINPHGWDDPLLSTTMIRGILTPQAAVVFGQPVSNSWPQLPQPQLAAAIGPAHDSHYATAMHPFQSQRHVIGTPSLGHMNCQQSHPSPASAIQSYAHVVVHGTVSTQEGDQAARGSVPQEITPASPTPHDVHAQGRVAGQQQSRLPLSAGDQSDSFPARPQGYIPSDRRPRSTATPRRMIEPAIPSAYGGLRSSQPSVCHSEVPVTQRASSMTVESRASSPGYYTTLLSGNDWHYRHPADFHQPGDQRAESTEWTGLEAPSLQESGTPGLGETSNARSSLAPPPTPRQEASTPPTMQPGNGDGGDILDLMLPANKLHGVPSNAPGALPKWPEPNDFESELDSHQVPKTIDPRWLDKSFER